MARPVVIRANYRDDAAYLLRLEQAVLKDNRRPSNWRDMIAAKLRDLSLTFLQAEIPAVPADSSDAKKKR